jgi:hypothetical protein
VLGTDAFTVATEKWRADASEKMAMKKAKVAPVKKMSVLKIVWLKPRPRQRGTSAIELAPTKPIGVSKKFCFSDVPSCSLGMVTKATGQRTARVIKFTCLGDSFFNTRGPSPAEKTAVMNMPMRSVVTPV